MSHDDRLTRASRLGSGTAGWFRDETVALPACTRRRADGGVDPVDRLVVAIHTTKAASWRSSVNFPLILGLMQALFGAATLLHLLVVSVTRRRREFGLLKSIGFVNSQVGATVCWQATTVALVGIVVGIPLGVAVGQEVWRAFATNLGAVPVTTMPIWVIAALGTGVLVVANLLAIAPALAAAKSKTAGQLLRTQ